MRTPPKFSIFCFHAPLVSHKQLITNQKTSKRKLHPPSTCSTLPPQAPLGKRSIERLNSGSNVEVDQAVSILRNKHLPTEWKQWRRKTRPIASTRTRARSPPRISLLVLIRENTQRKKIFTLLTKRCPRISKESCNFALENHSSSLHRVRGFFLALFFQHFSLCLSNAGTLAWRICAKTSMPKCTILGPLVFAFFATMRGRTACS